MTSGGSHGRVTPARAAVLAEVAAAVAALPDRTPRLVAVDGVDGAGKTAFADDLAAVLRGSGTAVVRTSIDGFHRPRAERYRRGRASPEGFFLDSFDLDAFRAAVVAPVRAGGDRRVRAVAFDHRTDAPVDVEPVEVGEDAVVLVDGVFLLRDELAGTWDLSVHLRASFAATFARMSVRDGCPADPDHPENRRYRDGQLLYLGHCDPERRATLVVAHDDPERPAVVTARAGA